MRVRIGVMRKLSPYGIYIFKWLGHRLQPSSYTLPITLLRRLNRQEVEGIDHRLAGGCDQTQAGGAYGWLGLEHRAGIVKIGEGTRHLVSNIGDQQRLEFAAAALYLAWEARDHVDQLDFGGVERVSKVDGLSGFS